MRRLGTRNIVLVGLMGSGKTSVGRRLAKRLDMRFVDADEEIELAAGKKVREIFADHGEAEFRDGERRVIARLLSEGPSVLATGGGAYMDPRTREAVALRGISVWLKAELPVLLERVLRRAPEDRPMLNKDGRSPAENLQLLMTERHPIYANADVRIETRDVNHEVVVEEIVTALRMSGKLPPPADQP